MKPIIPAIIAFAVIYAAALGVYDVALGGVPIGAGPTWHLWRFAGAGCLAASVVELVMLGIWAWQRATGKSTAGGVPLRLSDEDRRMLAQSPPKLALLMPAHNEASTKDDRVRHFNIDTRGGDGYIRRGGSADDSYARFCAFVCQWSPP